VYYKDSLPQLAKKYDCTIENPKLQGRNVAGNPTSNLNEIIYYSLNEGSSALNLADKSLITPEKLLKDLDLDISDEHQVWFKNTLTEEFVMSILMKDQIGNFRAFNGDKYDAGSIAGNTGASGSSLIVSYNPKKIGNFGKSIITFYGLNIDNTTKFTLKKQGENDIVAEKVQSTYSEIAGIYQCNATFNFHNKKIGKWDIVINVGDTATETIEEGLEIETYIEPEIKLNIIGSVNVRNDSWATYTVGYENTGNVAVYCLPVVIEIVTPKNVDVKVKVWWQTIKTDGTYTEETTVIDGKETKIYERDDPKGGNTKTTFVTPMVPAIPPYGKGQLTYSVKYSVNGIANDPLHTKAYALNPLATDNPALENALWDCLKTVAKMVWDVAKIPLGAIPGVGCAIQVGESVYSMATTEGSTGYKAGNAAAEAGKIITGCASSAIPGGTAVKTAVDVFNALSTANDLVGHATGLIQCGSALANLSGLLVGSKDPNDKIGPVNETGSTWISEKTDFTYVINFENDEKATAPAQEVWITDTLDLKVFDINTFEAGMMKFSDRVVTDIPFGTQNYTWSVDMRPEMDLITKINLNLDKAKGIAKWYFKSIDPATGELTTDALAGFLPPNNEDGTGQGFVMFSIKLKEGLADDVTIANKASIVFDNNAPIITPAWVNKKDIVPPSSSMLRPVTLSDNLVELRWSGTDNPGGSGIYCYDIFMKRENGAYELFLASTSQTTAQFTLEKDVKYSFYSIATDNAGNRENNKTKPDITIPEVNLPFDDYAATKWNNTFMLNLKKLREEGYQISACKWFKNSEFIGEGFTYSAGSQATDQLEAGAVYYFQLITSSHNEIYSTNKVLGKQKSSLKAYPNPIPQGNKLIIEGTMEGSLVEVFNYMGMCVSRTTATDFSTELRLSVPPGVYIVRTNNEAVKVIVR
jgi:hypothetical protein